jgi:hypothetical protein
VCTELHLGTQKPLIKKECSGAAQDAYTHTKLVATKIVQTRVFSQDLPQALV